MKNTTFRKQQWKMLLVTMLCYMFFYTGRHNFGWAAKAMAGELHVSYETIGWVSFSMLIGYAIGQLVNGNLADHFSPRIMIPLGGVLSVSCNVAISFAHSFHLVLILWALNGYCQSMAWAPGSRLISNWWSKEEKGKAFGFYTMAAGLSSVVTFLLSVVLLQQGLEWRWLFRIPVMFLLGGVIIFYIFARSKPSDMGFNNFSEELTELEKTTWQERYKAVFTNKSFMIACIAMGFESMARYGLIFWVPIHYLGKDWNKNPHYLWITVLMPIGMAIGALTFGNISGSLFKSNRPAAIRFGILVSALISLFIYFLPAGNIVVGAILLLLAGFFVYGPQANFWPMSPDILGEKYVGTGIGIMNMSAYLFAALGEPIIGKIIDVTKSTNSIFLFIAGLCMACAVTISFVQIRKNAYFLALVFLAGACFFETDPVSSFASAATNSVFFSSAGSASALILFLPVGFLTRGIFLMISLPEIPSDNILAAFFRRLLNDFSSSSGLMFSSEISSFWIISARNFFFKDFFDDILLDLK